MLILGIINSLIPLEETRQIIIQIDSQQAILHELFHARKAKESLERRHLCWFKTNVRVVVAINFFVDNMVPES